MRSSKTELPSGPALKFALYKEAMKILAANGFKDPWASGWNLIRGLGKNITNDWRSNDAECAEAVILHYSKVKLPKKK